MTRTDPHDVPRPDAQLHFGVFFQGVNHRRSGPTRRSGSQISPESYRQVAQTAERGLFDAFFLGEGLRLRESAGASHELDVAGRPDAITQLAALAAVTTKIGLVSTPNTTYNEPADLARRLAGLDLLSGGRAGWNIVTTDNAWTGANFRRGGYLDHADRYTRAEAFVDAARPIWDGWPDEAIARSDNAEWWAATGAAAPVRRRGEHSTVDVTPDAAAQRPVPSGDLPGRRLRRGPGLRRPQRRRHLLRSWHRLRRRARRSPATSGPAAPLRDGPTTTSASCPARRSSSGRPTTRPREGRVGAAIADHPGTALAPGRAAVEPRPVAATTRDGPLPK